MENLPSKSYYGKVLEIDLKKAKVETKALPEEVFSNYLGGRGLATRLFFDSVDPLCDPLSEENVIVLATSPLLGTTAPTASRGHIVFKSPLTGIIGSSNCGGSFAVAFKKTGYDALLIKGKASEPVIIDINPNRVEIIPAKNLWGKDVHKTTDALLEPKKKSERPKILCIGPAGENLVRFSAVMNDKNRAYGRCGPGAVFGSKNIKAIRVSGDMKVGVQDKDKYQSGLEQALYLMKQAPSTKNLLKELGTLGLIQLINLIDMLPCKNFQSTSHPEGLVEKISGEALRDNLLKKPGSCYNCPIACQRHTSVGERAGEGPEYETVVMLGPLCGVYDLVAIAKANYLCNELGMDTISLGGSLACAMELFERGIISLEDTEGIELRFGNPDILEKMVELIAYRRGIGARIAEGSFRLANFFENPQYSMTIKGLEIPGYDPRASFTQALGYITSPTGACHLRGGYAVSLAFFGGTKEVPRFSVRQSPIAIRNMQNLGIIQDSLGICRFTGFAFSLEPWARMVSGATGIDFSTKRLEEIANRVATLERIFNLKAGLKPEDDNLPERFKKEPIIVDGKERVITRDALLKMRRDYYSIRGWDEEGKPSESLLKELGIDD